MPKIAHYAADNVVSFAPLAGQEANLLEGLVIGVTNQSKATRGDFRASAGPVKARGFSTHAMAKKDAFGNTMQVTPRLSITNEGRVGGFTALIPGADYYLLTGGTIQPTKPATATGDIDQKVGWAIDTETLMIEIGTPVVHA